MANIDPWNPDARKARIKAIKAATGPRGTAPMDDGTYRAMIIPNISFALPLTVYTLLSFFRQLPWELEEAARVDGASRGQAFRLVLLPLAAQPALDGRRAIEDFCLECEQRAAKRCFQMGNHGQSPLAPARD